MKQATVIFDDAFVQLDSFLAAKNYSKVFFLTDSNTHDLCLPLILSDLKNQAAYEIIEIPPGEASKIIEIVVQVWETLSELGASRKSLLVNLGGGVITDMGGFIASTFKRGMDFINLPTSLLAMVDASVGGKTGINLNRVKNQVGTFAQPQTTFIHPGFLHTLPKRDLRSGFAEMLKHGLIYDQNHWQKLIRLKKIEVKTIQGLIPDSVQIKTEIVKKDPLEKGLRKILNFGHTIGHAVESTFMNSERPLLHGEAVAVGMLVETMLSFENELISKDELDEIFTHLIRIFGKTRLDENSIPDLIHLMKHDKKNPANAISFSLLNGIGNSMFDILLNENQISEGISLYNRKLENFK